VGWCVWCEECGGGVGWGLWMGVRLGGCGGSWKDGYIDVSSITQAGKHKKDIRQNLQRRLIGLAK